MEINNFNNFAKNLSYLRTQRNLTQTQLAKEIGVSRQSISNYENGNREPELSSIIKLSRYFDCSIDEMVFNGTDTDINTLKKIENFNMDNDFIEKLINYNNILEILIKNKKKLELYSNTIPQKLSEIDDIIEFIQDLSKNTK